MKKIYTLAVILTITFSLGTVTESVASSTTMVKETLTLVNKVKKKNHKAGKSIVSIFSKKSACPAYR